MSVDEHDWHQLISQPKYGVAVEKNVFVKMRDGVRLAVDIFRPNVDGRFPALLSMSPYGKEIQALALAPQPAGGPLWDGCIEAGDVNYTVPRGYVHVIADIRGTGYSEGEYVGVFSRQEGIDGYDLVEWIAQQSWCDGNVGMIGISYFGQIQLRVAIEQPPHLKAIMPMAAWTDTYRHVMYNGGVLCSFWYGLWDGRGGDSGYAMRNVVSAMAKNMPGQEFQRELEKALANPDIQKFSNYYHLLKYPQKNPLFVDILLNPLDGPFYRERSAVYDLHKINVPVYTIGSWLRGWLADAAISTYDGVNTPKKLMIDPADSLARPWTSYHDVAVRWNDHWLKGINTGIMDEPPIKLFVKGENQWHYEHEWPPAGMKPIQFFLRSFGRLGPEPESYMDQPDCFSQQPLHVSYEIRSLRYSSSAMREDVEVIGPVALHIFASIDQEDTNWIANLYDVSPEGVQHVAVGYLKASHRAIDDARSTPLKPYHTHEQRETIVPGQIYEYAIELSPIAHVFKAGHQIMLEIRSLEHSGEGEGIHPPLFYHLCSSNLTVHKIYRDKKHRSYLLLPVVKKEG